MTSETRNYIAGQWQDGSQTVENRNPSDLADVIGRGAASFGPREQGHYAAEFYTTVKTACVAAGTPE